MVVLDRDQTAYMVKVMDTILRNPKLTVGEIKCKYSLTDEEYAMIFELTMPMIRELNVKRYWAVKYKNLVDKIMSLLFSTGGMTLDKFKTQFILITSDSANEPFMREALGEE